MAIEILRQPDEHRYLAQLDGNDAGTVTYRERPGLIAFLHTNVDERFEGHGIGSALAAHVLDDARARGLSVLPFCPFIAGWIRRHREYVDLVPEQQRASFDL